MAINSRAKGQRGERMVADLLNSACIRVAHDLGCKPPVFSRNLVQSRNGGHDLVGMDWIAVEVKWYAEVKSQLARWWEQTLRQAQAVNAEPVLIYKANGSKWSVRMYGRLEIAPGRRLRVPVDISMDNFLVWFEKRVALELSKEATLPVDVGLFD